MKKILAMLLSILMIATMLPFQALAADPCDHMITADVWNSLPDSVKQNNPNKEPNANGNGDVVPAFVNATLPASCEDDGWELHAGDDHGFCFLCGEIIPSDIGDPLYTTLPATGHNYVTTTEPTCTSLGKETCSNDHYEWAPTGSPGNYSPTYTVTPCGDSQDIAMVDHAMGDWTVVTDATCTTAGTEQRVCTNESGADAYTETREIPAKGHTWDAGVVTAPTCEEDGYTTYTCTACGATEKRDVVDAIGHDWGDWTETKATSCAEAGIETRVCKNDASHVETREISKLEHVYGDTTTVAPTCTLEGYDTHTCTICGHEERTHKTSALGHQLGSDAVVEEAATCTVDGIAVGTCVRCGQRQVRTVIPATGHDWSDWTVETAATCDDNGLEKRVCNNDASHVETRDIAATGHDWGDWEVVTPATCTTAGMEQCVCKNDPSHIQTREIQPLDHDWDAGVVTNPTCTEGGYTTYTCTRCGETKVDNQTAALGHDPDMSNVTVVKEATCEADGYNEAPCLRCGNTVRIITPAIGHAYVANVVAPGCETQGYTEYVCQNDSSHTYRTDLVDALGHDWDAGVVTTPADCETTGEKLYTCQRDSSHTYTETLPALHHDWQVSNVVAPTCTEDGYTEYICANNSSHTKTEVDADSALGHNYDVDGDGEIDWVVTTPATCTTTGVETATCTRCGHEITQEIPMEPHQFEATRISYPTCTERGQIIYTCKVCGHITQSFEDATGHNYDDSTNLNCMHGNTCSNVDQNTGLVCGAEDDSRDYSVTFASNVTTVDAAAGTYSVEGYDFDPTTDVVSTGHDYNWTFTDATCEGNGYWTGVCERTRNGETCPETVENHTITVECKNTAFGHHWSLLDDGSAMEPTCTTDGVRHYICLNDRTHTYTETIPAYGHQYVEDYTQYVAPTGHETGKRVFVCKNVDHYGNACNDTYEIILPATGNHNYSLVSTTPATCTEEGTATYACQDAGCTASYTVATTPATGHQFVEDADQFIAASCEADGQRVYVCKNNSCTESYKVVLPKTGHNYGKTEIVLPTCTTEGYTKHICINPNCTDSYINDYTSKIDHVMAVTDTVAPTCGEDGYVTYYCANCDYTYNEVLSATGNHQYDEVVTVQPTCTTKGVLTYTCSVCGYTYTEEIPMLGHTAVSADNAVLPTCETAGHQADTICAVCGELLATGAKLNATGHNYGKVEVVPPTCTAGGYTKHICTNDGCDEYYINDYTSKIDHVMAVTETVAPTCGADGYVTYHCANCDYSYNEVLSATGNHQYDEVVTVQPTCTTKGVLTYTCSVCGYTYTEEIPMLGHTAVSADNAVLPTCETAGHQSDTICSVCGELLATGTKLNPTGHNYGKVEVVPPTCTAAGYTKHICTNDGCDEYYVNDYTSKIDHVMAVTETVAPTCGADGHVTYKCANCDYSYNEVLSATGDHKYSEVVTTQPTCTTKGVLTYTCSVCGYTYTEEIPTLGHTAVSAENGVAPTCNVDGKESDIICSVCGVVLETGAVIPATGDHKYSEVVTTQPTCTTKGVLTYTCSVCGAAYTEEIPTLGHDYKVTATVDATCTTEGYDTYTCANEGCTSTYNVTTTPATGHQYVISAEKSVAPTCDVDGKNVYVCANANCDATYEEVVPATGDHKYTEDVKEEATCTENGVMLHQCEVCEACYFTVIPATGHAYKYVETPATCTADGKMTATCENCGDVQTYRIPATGHIYDTQGVYTAPTCTEDGYITYKCTVCNQASRTITEGRAAGHVYKASVTNKATLNANGTITTACVHCGKASSEVIPGIGKITLSDTKYLYNGKAVRPSVTVYDTNGNKLDRANYSVSYSNNKKIGVAKVKITFKGDKYTGTITKSFKIIPKNVGISTISTKSKKITFRWGKVAKCDGYQIQYSTSKTFKSKKTVTIKNRKTASRTLKNLKSGKKYYIRIRAYKIVDGKKIYGNWSTATKVCK